ERTPRDAQPRAGAGRHHPGKSLPAQPPRSRPVGDAPRGRPLRRGRARRRGATVTAGPRTGGRAPRLPHQGREETPKPTLTPRPRPFRGRVREVTVRGTGRWSPRWRG